MDETTRIFEIPDKEYNIPECNRPRARARPPENGRTASGAVNRSTAEGDACRDRRRPVVLGRMVMWFAALFLTATISLNTGLRAEENILGESLHGEASSAVHARPDGWRSLSTPHFELQYPPRLEPIARALHPQLENTLEELSEKLGVSISERIVVRLAGDKTSFRLLHPSAPPDWAAATAMGENLITLRTDVIPGVVGISKLHQTFVHELAHILINRAFGRRRAPRWINEGIARLVAGEYSLEERALLGQAVLLGRLIPISELDAGFPIYSGRASLAYAQSRDFFRFLIDVYGSQAIKAFLRDVRQGQSAEDALWNLTGLNLASLEEDWHENLNESYIWLAALVGGSSLWSIAAGLSLLAWSKKRRQSRLRRAQWEIEEALAYGEAPGVAIQHRRSWLPFGLGKDRLKVVKRRHPRPEEVDFPPQSIFIQEEPWTDDDPPWSLKDWKPRRMADAAWDPDEGDDDTPPPGGWLH